MDSKRIKVLHVTDCNAVVTAVAHDFVLEFLPSTQVLINQNLRTIRKGLGCEILEFCIVGSESRSKTTECKGSTNENGVSNLVGSYQRVIDRIGTVRQSNRFTNLLELGTKDFTIFRGFNHGNLSTQHFHSGSLQLSRLPQFHTDIERRLSSHGHNDSIRLFLVDDVHDDMRSNGKKVDAIGCILGSLRSLHGGNIGINQNDFNSLFLESLDTLTTRVVKLSCLSNTQTATSHQQDFFVRFAMIRKSILQDERLRNLAHMSDKLVKQKGCIKRTTTCFGMKLYRKEWFIRMHNTLIGQVIGI
mmetsp:Transcript_26373/g.47644  ORF Transcript_26373/g.47644 Transcript_26373/m.47644 type:complete len:302 (-) Transcript_26373:97-1002(-)